MSEAGSPEWQKTRDEAFEVLRVLTGDDEALFEELSGALTFYGDGSGGGRGIDSGIYDYWLRPSDESPRPTDDELAGFKRGLVMGIWQALEQKQTVVTAE